jgi:hypothetical protein
MRGGLDEAYEAMQRLATSRPPAALADEAYELYAQFRPAIPAGPKGWGGPGALSLEAIRQLATEGAAR